MDVTKPDPWVLRWSGGNFAYIQLVCLTRLEILLPFVPFTEMTSVLEGDQVLIAW